MPVGSSEALRARRALGLAVGIIAGATVGCTAGSEEPTVAGAWYHAHLTGREPEQIPFFLHVPDDCAAGPATIVNGEERITAPCGRSGGNLVIEFPIYATGIEASFESGDRLAGTWYRELPTGRQELMVFEARAIDEPDPRTRFPAEPAEPAEQPGVSITGIWRMEFNLYGIAKGVFDQHSSGVVTASVEVPSEYGDMRFLAGNVIGDLVLLSTFDGQNAFYLEGDVADGDATMEGVWIFSTYWDEFVAERVEDFDIIDPLSRVRYTTNDQRFDLPALRDPKYAGKAVIVQIFATWCPNCSDHAPVLAELYRVHNAEGLEILGLAFEQTDDNAYSARRVQAFRERHGVDWDIVVADSRLEDIASEGLAGLSAIEGVPVTIFVNRDGTVHAVYTGFSGPAAGEAHDRAIARFRQLTEEILDGAIR